MWIELFVFLLVFAFAAHQFYDLKKERKKTTELDENSKESKESERVH